MILRGGNLRSEPRVAADTAVGLVWPGDEVTFLERQTIDRQPWLRARLNTPAANRGGPGVTTGITGWISALLLTAPPAPAPATHGAWPPASLAPAIADGQLPGEGQWRPLPATGDGGIPAMAVMVLRPDAARPDIQVAIVAIDLGRAQLHMVAGTQEPPGAPEVARLGAIPVEVQQSGRLLAAFNGGFKAIHGDEGMGVDGVTYLPPVRNRATIAVTNDGAVRLGLWGRDPWRAANMSHI